MANVTFRGQFVIWLSFIIALILQAAPWPGELAPFRPSWVLLVTFYWVLALPHRVNVGTALVLGLLWDLMLGSTLGVRGLMMAILVYIVALNFQLLRNMSYWQQALLLALLTLAGKLIEFWAEYLVSNVQFNPEQLWAGVLNFILWPWIFLLLRRLRRRFAIR
ncbi:MULTISPECIES: rod shape-determining protein MreD [Salinivibrio]|uniref:Rod shape-determining protein MreD n=2 Tax=Salinivibrio TaxID=51366 RepID=A0A1V3GJW8_9GAMM|nr:MULTISPECIES: rod shape-determining protein MreD [Salinivibrio]KKA45233.1 rod shape-determining protein MreD [Salinivibrio sp. KP-1]MPS33437.1 rod shape-determining protein MreD [Salinivibrio sp. VYel7]MPX91720.1 rod shape-determining protein MreD [Salinivibrio sp. VYel1]MPX94821.1 rod shape-determining protein MreD [Salinivibrio sp. VYel9]MPX97590.1 rod shape-determining protein MreD [Salinivibrio sp. VYel6]